MIVLKTSRELAIMREACRISAKALRLAGEAVEPGVSTWEIDRVVRRAIEEEGGKPNFLGYGGFPGSACVSVNDVVIHGIPHKEIILKEGDIVSVDVGACLEGFHGDCAGTYPCGQVSEEAIDAEYEKMAEQYKMEASKLKELMGPKEKEMLTQDLAVQQAVDLLVAEAKLV